MHMSSTPTSSPPSFETVPFPPSRRLVVDAGILASKRHCIYGLIEVDVTEAKRKRDQLKASVGSTVFFTSYLVACVARAVAVDPSVQAYRQGQGKLVIFQDVDVVTMIEPTKGAVAIPHIIRQANQKTVQEISAEIASVKDNPSSSDQSTNSSKLMKMALKIPRWMRMLCFRWLQRNPFKLRETQGTVILTSIGMFGNSGGWGLTFLPLHTLGITVGGIQAKPAVVEGQIVPRDILNITIAFDHDIVDGAPAARFASRLVNTIEQSVDLIAAV